MAVGVEVPMPNPSPLPAPPVAATKSVEEDEYHVEVEVSEVLDFLVECEDDEVNDENVDEVRVELANKE